MNRYLEISRMPTVVNTKEHEAALVHESVLRSHQILNLTKELLDKSVAPDVILELIDLMETAGVHLKAQAVGEGQANG